MGKRLSILIKKWQGKLSAQEEQELLDLLSNQQIRKEADALKDVWNKTGSYYQSFQPDTDQAWHRFKQSLQPEPATKTNWYWIILMIGLLLAGAACFYLLNKGEKSEIETVEGNHYANSSAKPLKVILPDGSEVMLNKNSELSVLKQDGRNFDLRLEGEAFFQIASLPGRTFTVYAGEAMAVVVGTSFNIRYYPEESMTELEVAEGTVAFSEMQRSTSEDPITVGALERAVCEPGKEISKRLVSNLNAQSWLTGKLVWEDESVAEVVKDLERRFDVEFHLESDFSDAACNISYTVDQESSMEDVINGLAFKNILIQQVGDHQYRVYRNQPCI